MSEQPKHKPFVDQIDGQIVTVIQTLNASGPVNLVRQRAEFFKVLSRFRYIFIGIALLVLGCLGFVTLTREAANIDRAIHPRYPLAENPWLETFEFHSLLTNWHFQEGMLKEQQLTWNALSYTGIVVRPSTIATPRIFDSKVLDDFDFDMSARPLVGRSISWALRVQKNRQSAYVFEIRRLSNMLELHTYVYPGRHELTNGEAKIFRGCCSESDFLTIHVKVREKTFTVSATYEVEPEQFHADSDATRMYSFNKVYTDGRYRSGNIGLMEIEPAGAMLVRYIRVIQPQ